MKNEYYYIYLIILIIFSIAFGVLISDNVKDMLIPSSSNSECSGDAVSISNCLRDELETWWTYNISNLYLYWPTKDINWSIIKQQGGVCWQSAEWYVTNAKSKGLYAKSVDISPHHTIAIISDDLGNYCIADQTLPITCHKVG